jgi:hypothetical protein
LENVDIFYAHLELFADIRDIFMTIWYILCSFGFGIMYEEKSGNPGFDHYRRRRHLTYDTVALKLSLIILSILQLISDVGAAISW